jgi:hypothetical protein
VRIIINNPKLRRWLWFIGIYAGSIAVFGAITGVLAMFVPSK